MKSVLVRVTAGALLAFVACSHGSTGPNPPPTGTPKALAFVTQPTNATAGVPITPSVQVKVVDSTGATVTTFSGSVTIALSANPGSASLIGATTVATASGIATFALTLDSTATGYTLAASATGLTGVTSSAFNITPGPSSMTALLGDHQPGLEGFAVNKRPAVIVKDVHGAAVSGLTVTFSVTSGSGSATGTSVMTNSSGIAQVGSWTLGAGAGVNTLSASIPGTVTGNPTVFTDTALAEGYTITIKPFGAGLPASAQAAFTAAVTKWSQIIYRPLPSQSLLGITAGACAPKAPALSGSTTGIVIYASVDSIDGAGKILAEAGPCAVRPADGLTYVGVMLFDSADIGGLISAGTLNSVVLHEMGHVLGFGTLWGPPSGPIIADCLQLPSTPPGTIQDTYFSCPLANAQFDSIGGGSYTGGHVVPVENCGTSPYVYPTCGGGTVNGHWRQVAFVNELMVGFLPSSPKLSVVTVGVLEDLGYTVNYAGADAFVHTFTAPPVGGTAAPGVNLGNDVWRGPLYVGSPSGAVRAVKR